MEQSPAERYEIYTSDNPLPNPHPAPGRPAYVPENTGERSLSPPIFVRPLGPAVQLPRKPRSVMYKAKIHDLLIYASLIISALALILATRNGSTQGIVTKGKEMAEKTTELVHLVPQPGKTSQVRLDPSCPDTGVMLTSHLDYVSLINQRLSSISSSLPIRLSKLQTPLFRDSLPTSTRTVDRQTRPSSRHWRFKNSSGRSSTKTPKSTGSRSQTSGSSKGSSPKTSWPNERP